MRHFNENSTPSSEIRLALCGNVFPGDTAASVFCALEGPVLQWAKRLRDHGFTGPIGFGLYLSDQASKQVLRDEAKLGRLAQALCRAGVEVWTANAFPFGGFHGTRVKEKAFLPDWRSKERLAFSCRVAEILAHLMMPDTLGSFSTCPLGYGPDARRSFQAVSHLQYMQEYLLLLQEKTGVKLTLAIEPEPDGSFERVPALAEWLSENVLESIAPDDRRVGVCWDLCHSAVVGETSEEVLHSLEETRIPLGKIQISAALQTQAGLNANNLARFSELAEDPYFHQVRGTLTDGRACAFSDLPKLLHFPDRESVHNVRVHCHVPVHCQDYGDGLRGTEWRNAVKAALDAGHRDFELETYTLPVLPEPFLQSRGLVGTMVEEMLACGESLGKANTNVE